MDLFSLFSFHRDEQSFQQIPQNSGPKDLRDLIERLDEIKSAKAKDIMVPRSLVEAIDVDLEIHRLHSSRTGHPYLPVYRGDLDNVLGWIGRDVLQSLIHDGHVGNLRTEYVPIDFISEDMPLDKAFLKFVKTSAPLFAVQNGAGLTSGILYLSDVLEIFFGLDVEPPLTKPANG